MSAKKGGMKFREIMSNRGGQCPPYLLRVMLNHWHFVIKSTSDDQLSEFFRRLTVAHTMRWYAHYRTGGTGHLYRGRFKSFPNQSDSHAGAAVQTKIVGGVPALSVEFQVYQSE